MMPVGHFRSEHSRAMSYAVFGATETHCTCITGPPTVWCIAEASLAKRLDYLDMHPYSSE
jgi:hypothetical protein